MLSISLINSINYYCDLTRDDYYHNGGEPPGQWMGKGCAFLGMSKEVKDEHYKRIFSGFDPFKGHSLPLIQSAGKDNHRSGWDFCFSAPKSVSVLWSQVDQNTQNEIQKAQSVAVRAAVKHLEKNAAWTRRGKGGAELERPLGLIASAYEHGCSREQDPQLHSHALIANVAPRSDGTYGSLEVKDMFRHKMAAGAIYRAELAKQLQCLGLTVEPDGNSFKVCGVGKDIEQHFSKRREQILNALSVVGHNSVKAAEIAALDTRRKKEIRSRFDLFLEWKQRAKKYDFDLNRVFRIPESEPEVMISPEKILKVLTHHASTFSDADIYRTVATEGQGKLSASDIERYVDDLYHSSELVAIEAASGEQRYSTREMIFLEQHMVVSSHARKNENYHPVTEVAVDQAAVSRTMSEQQTLAFNHVVSGHDGVVCIQGIAGAGKSYLLGAAREAWEKSGYTVRGATLAGKAASGLQEGAGIKSQTIHSLLKELKDGKTLNSKDILVVDEAGMVGSRQMSMLIELSAKSRAKLVLVGDAKQLQPVDAGGAFRAITRSLGCVELTEIRRQKQNWAAQAVHDFAEGNAVKALTAYSERGLLSIAKTRHAAMSTMVDDWFYIFDSLQPKETLMLASTRAEVGQLNALARQKIAEQGGLGPGAQIDTEHSKIEILEKDRILFTRNSKQIGVSNGTLGTVERMLPERSGNGWQITVRLDSGHKVKFNTENYSYISHGYAVTTHKSQGVTVDNALILGGGSMTSREMAYVQMSRHKKMAKLYVDQLSVDQVNTVSALAKEMNRERQKDTTIDYLLKQQDILNEEVEEICDATIAECDDDMGSIFI